MVEQDLLSTRKRISQAQPMRLFRGVLRVATENPVTVDSPELTETAVHVNVTGVVVSNSKAVVPPNFNRNNMRKLWWFNDNKRVKLGSNSV